MSDNNFADGSPSKKKLNSMSNLNLQTLTSSTSILGTEDIQAENLDSVNTEQRTNSKFTTYLSYEIHENKQVAICLECSKSNIKTVIKRTSGNTSGLKKHLALKYPKVHEIIFGF